MQCPALAGHCKNIQNVINLVVYDEGSQRTRKAQPGLFYKATPVQEHPALSPLLSVQARACRGSNPELCVGVTVRPPLNQRRYGIKYDDSVSQLQELRRFRHD